MRIYLIRHGRQSSPLLNANVGLSKEGKEQAQLLGERLKKNYAIDVLYSSDYVRAVETASIVNSYLNVKHKLDKRFREVNLGGFTGLTNNQAKEKYKDFLIERAKMTSDNPYPNGGENCEMVFNRAFAGIKDILKTDYENVCVVMHGAVLRALLTGIIGADYAKWLVLGRQIENCSITELFYDKAMDSLHIERFNDYAHLEGKPYLLRGNYSQGFFNVGTREKN